jgi:hypothetical protein
MNTEPSNAVVSRKVRHRRTSPRWIAPTANAMVRELNSSTKLDTDVNGMSKTFAGSRSSTGPLMLRCRRSR